MKVNAITCPECKGEKKMNKKLKKSLKKGLKEAKKGKVTKVGSIEKLETKWKRERKKHPVYCFLRDLYYRVYRFVERIPLDVKTFIQRGKRGWANRDTWSFDYYLTKVISEAVYHLKENTNGMPNDLTEGQWIDILNKIIYTFELAKRMSEDELYLIKDKKVRDKWQKTLDELNKKHKSRDRCMTNKEIREYEEGWKLFKEYFFELWD